MIPLGLNSAGLKALQATLADHHSIRVRVQTQTLAGAPDVDLTARLTDGQVNVDNGADITRTATLTLLDPDRALPFDSDAPADSALFLDRMLRIDYQVAVDGTWVDVPVFTGPVSKLDRSGDTIHVEAQGKEVLAMGACWKPITLRRGLNRVSAIKTLLSARTGETRFSLPSVPGNLPRPVSLGRESIPWAVARSIASSMNRQLFYDGAGTCRLRTYPGTPVYTFTAKTMLTPLQISYSGDTINTVWVTGATPKGAHRPVTHTSVAPPSHALSPQRLGRNGVPRYLLSVVQDDSIRSTAEAKAFADRSLADHLRQSIDASFDALPIPHIEPGDLVVAVAAEGTVVIRLRSFSLPLTTNGSMSVGYLKNVSVSTKRRGNKR